MLFFSFVFFSFFLHHFSPLRPSLFNLNRYEIPVFTYIRLFVSGANSKGVCFNIKRNKIVLNVNN